MPSLAILDDYLEISKAHFQQIPSSSLRVKTFTTPFATQTDLVAALQPFEAISTMRERTAFPASLLSKLPNLKVLFCTGTQFETFDLKAAKELGITVVAAPGRGRTDRPAPAKRNLQNISKGGNHPTTHHTWALILALARNVAFDDAVVKSGGWQTGMAMGLMGKTLGVLGMGRLGSAVARLGSIAFGMKIVCWSSSLDQAKADQKAVELGLPVEDAYGEKTFQVVTKEELLRVSDIVTLHYVLSERTRGLINASELAAMKPTALLVNTSRGALIDQPALIQALQEGRIGAAAIDVFEQEPLPADSPWRSHNWGKDGKSKVIVTPHMGEVEEGIMNTWYGETAENVERWVDGKELLHRIA